MRLSTVLLFLGTHCLFSEGNMDWCEYWTKMGRQVLYSTGIQTCIQKQRPECVGYTLPENRMGQKTVQLSPLRSRNPADKASPARCDSTEMIACADCESRCDQQSKQHQLNCEKKRCARKVCICRGDLYRDSLGNCVDSCPRTDSSLLASMKRMVPLLLKDMWRSVFRAFRSSAKQMKQPENNITFIPA